MGSITAKCHRCDTTVMASYSHSMVAGGLDVMS
jgi:hypothetical protein